MGRSDSGTDACPVGVECDSDEQPEHEATVASFYLDTFEVTVGRFRRFVEGYRGRVLPGAGAHPLIANSGWQAEWDARLPGDRSQLERALRDECGDWMFPTWTELPGANENRPINCVTWYEAFAFCAWDGGRLPTEAEWERAAAGGEENRLYPWGSAQPDLSITSYSMLADGISGRSSIDDLPVVGSYPRGRGRWGHEDLGGGVYEVVLDCYAEDWYERGRCDNCANLCPAEPDYPVWRGNGFNNLPTSHRAANRFGKRQAPFTSETRQFYHGFRCARDR